MWLNLSTVFLDHYINDFRLLEQDVYENFQAPKGAVIALGGGALLNEKIFSLTKKWGFSGRLELLPEIIFDRWQISSPLNLTIDQWPGHYDKRQKACLNWSARIWSNCMATMIKQMHKIAKDEQQHG